MKKLIMFVLIMIVALSSACYANETKKQVSVVYFNDSNLNKNDVNKIIYGPIVDILSSKFNVLEDSTHKEKLVSQGLNDVATIDKGDLLNAFKDDVVTSYIVLIQIDPCLGPKNIAGNLKIIDLKQQSYLFNGRILRDTTWGSPFSVLKKIAKENENIIQAKLINNKQQETPQKL